jgi:hypothetical protein
MSRPIETGDVNLREMKWERPEVYAYHTGWEARLLRIYEPS